MGVAFVFPGQGSQAVGMGKALADTFAAARAVFAEVDAALGQNLSELMWDGPDSDLTLTENAQPALMAVSMAAIRVLEAEHGITVANAPGTIDADYRGEVKVILINLGEAAVTIARGERIAQLVIAPVTAAELATSLDLPETQRGTGGFGSTGR